MTRPLNFSTEVVENLLAEQVEIINNILRVYNRTSNSELWAKFDDPSYDPMPLNIVAFNATKELVGGLLATTSMSWLKIDIMAVREDDRHQGVGTSMLKVAEAEARRRDCKYSFIDTMDYQSPEFYRKCGYDVAGTIADWDSHGHTKYYFTKTL